MFGRKKDESPADKALREARELKKAEQKAEKEKKEQERRDKEQKKLEKISVQASTPVPGPASLALAGEPAGQALSEFPIGQKIEWEVTRLVQGNTSRITIVKGQIVIKADRFGRPPKALFIKVSRAGRTDYYFADTQRLIKVTTIQGRKKEPVESYKVVFHEFISEPMKIDGTIEWSDELELLQRDSGLDQYVQIASSDLGFQFTPTLKRAMLLIGIMGVLLGLAINGTYHFIPTTIVHWIP